MPQCRRCERVQATAELRRTTRGYVCKDGDPGSRCHTIAAELRAAARAKARELRKAARRRRDRRHAAKGAAA